VFEHHAAAGEGAYNEMSQETVLKQMPRGITPPLILSSTPERCQRSGSKLAL